MGGGLLREATQTEDVSKEAAEISVVHDFGGRGTLVLRGDRGIRDNPGNEFVQPRIGDGGGEFLELREKLFDILLGVRKKVGKVNLFGFRKAKLQERKLRPVAVDFYPSVDLDEVVAGDAFGSGFELIPHARFDGAAAVAELQAQILFALASVPNLFFVNEEKRSHGLFRVEIGDEGRLHVPDAGFLPHKRNSFSAFFSLLTSGVSLTS